MKSKIFLIIIFLASTFAFSLAGDPKNKYDINNTSFSKSSGIPFLGWKIKKSISEVTVLPGFYFTWGTIAGKSSSTLDNNTSILFGHPYAKTSFPLISVDGIWKRIDMVFPSDSSKVVFTGDSSVTVKNSAHLLFSFEATFQLMNNGEGIKCIMRLINNDIVSHSLSLGLIIDPAIGNRGDAVVTVNDKHIKEDTSFSTSLVTLSERKGNVSGIRAMVNYSDNIPTTLIKNWNADDIYNPSFAPDKIRKLYDVVVKSFWTPVTVQSHDTLVKSFSLILTEPNFGSSVFTRWDVPRFLGMEDGIMRPSEFSSTASIINNSDQGKTVNVRLTNNNYINVSAPQKDTTVSAQQIGYVHFPLSVKEIYEDIVTDLELITSVNAVAVDTLTIPLFIPSTPVSDTGLTVTIDSLIVSAKPKISTIFEVTRNSNGQKVFFLKPENIFLYENNSRIHNYSLQKDTSGGADALDLIFVLDVTGSMGGTIDGVKNNIIEFTDSLTKQGVDFRLGMVTFLDVVENIYDFVNDAQTFKNLVALQNAHGGGDAPENSLEALFQATKFQFRNNANRVIIWITDITYHENNTVTTRTKTQVIDALLQNDITVNAIGPQAYQTDWYNPIIEPTGGSYYNIFGNFRDILLDISRIKTTSKFLLSYNSPNTGSGERTVKLEIHFAGLGGSATTLYQNPLRSLTKEPLACYPNPFNPQTTIQVHVPSNGIAKITIYNILGKQTRQFEVNAAEGPVSITWDATDNNGNAVASGVYLVRAEVVAPNGMLINSETAKVIYLK
ncbi:MAG: VWA domain-containing protein [Bacteroidota bacterium]|nr:VWA domain-containing protein [Bacteroidota bacterium]